MLHRRLAAPDRTPGARVLGVARLDGWEMRFHKRSNVDGSGKCGIVRSSETTTAVYGVVYEIPLDELPALDEAEGLGNGYLRRLVDARLVASEARVEVLTYVTQSEHRDETLRPFGWYKALVVAGAREHALPGWYRRQLEAVEALVDPVRQRSRRFRKLLAKPRD